MFGVSAKLNSSEAVLGEFAFSLGGTRGFVERILNQDELLTEFASRGIRKGDLEKLREDIDRVSQVFYTKAQPF